MPRDQPIRSEPTPKRVRALAGGRIVADSERARIVWFGPVARTYAFPPEDLAGKPGDPAGHVEDPIAGRVPAGPLEHEGGTIPNAVMVPDTAPGLEGHVILAWEAMDAWFEEEDEVFVHPHDPRHRLDIRASARAVRVEVDGVVLAEADQALILFETGLPPRYYVPPTSLRWEALERSETETGCAYKGFAQYVHARVGGARHEDVGWRYPTTFPGADRIAGQYAFFQERVDMFVDGARLERPATPWRREQGDETVR